MHLIRKRTYLALAIIVLGFAVFLLVPSNNSLSLNSYQEYETKIKKRVTDFGFFGKNYAKPLEQPSEPIQKSDIHPTGSELQISIPQGAKLPAAFMDEGNPEDSEGVKELLLSLEKEFQEEYRTGLRKGLTSEDAWENARSKSDERYQALFGQEAYLEALNLAAEEARTDWETSQ
jgi:hypothetical protein